MKVLVLLALLALTLATVQVTKKTIIRRVSRNTNRQGDTTTTDPQATTTTTTTTTTNTTAAGNGTSTGGKGGKKNGSTTKGGSTTATKKFGACENLIGQCFQAAGTSDDKVTARAPCNALANNLADCNAGLKDSSVKNCAETCANQCEKQTTSATAWLNCFNDYCAPCGTLGADVDGELLDTLCAQIQSDCEAAVTADSTLTDPDTTLAGCSNLFGTSDDSCSSTIVQHIDCYQECQADCANPANYAEWNNCFLYDCGQCNEDHTRAN